MVDDFISDYNIFSDNIYIFEILLMDKDSLLDIVEFMYEEIYRIKWLWLIRYLRLVGLDINKFFMSVLLV